MPNSQARSVPRAGLVGALLAVGALERGGGDVLGRRAIAQQRRHVGVDVVARRPVERLEVQRRAGRARWDLGGQRAGHIRYYDGARNPSQTPRSRQTPQPRALRLFRDADAHAARDPARRAAGGASAAAAEAARAAGARATSGRRSTSATRRRGRTRSASAAAWTGWRARRACTCASASSTRRARATGDRQDRRRLGLAQGRLRPRGEHDAGWTFEFEPPASGGAHVLRGLVQFEWRRAAGSSSASAEVTEAGHPGTAGAEPRDFSAATCAIA